MRRLATLLLLATLVTGCGQSKQDEQRNAAKAARLAEALERLPGFLLDVQEPDGSCRTGIEDVRFSDLQDDLRRRHGPRPVPDR